MEQIKLARDLFRLIYEKQLSIVEKGLIKDFLILKTIQIIKEGKQKQAETYSHLFRIFDDKLNDKEWSNFFFTLGYELEIDWLCLRMKTKYKDNWKNRFKELLKKYNISGDNYGK